jgi:hypothetical protein
MYAWRRRPRDRRWSGWRLWLTIGVYSLSLIGSRIGMQISAPIF